MLIYGDPIRLHQVLGNLISNSLKFTEDGSVTIGARLDSETLEKATLTFWVKDTGIGISDEQKAKRKCSLYPGGYIRTPRPAWDSC